MNTRKYFLIVIGCPLVLTLIANKSLAQSPYINLEWQVVEVGVGTNTPVPVQNGLLEPGEAARFELNISFTPEVGSTIPYTPPPPPGVATVAGFYFGDVDFAFGPGSVSGSWGLQGSAPGWNVGGAWIPDPFGSIAGGCGQFPLNGATAIPDNPVRALRWLVWTPTTYEPRAQSWASSFHHGRAALIVEYARDPNGNPLYVGVLAGVTGMDFGSIPIVPAPASAAALLLALPLASRRHRR
ncbi:MAG: hypothetical protein ACKVW3_07590 [Phycisphaerales bacterium]